MVKGAKGLSDPRFVHLKSDPKFGGLKRKERKVVLEDRFAGALTDARFTRAPLVDKRGRKVKRTGDATLHRLYEIEEKKNEEEEDDEDEEATSEAEEEEEEEHGEEDEASAESDQEAIPVKTKYDLARGEGDYDSSSSDEEEEEEEEGEGDAEEEQNEGIDHDWGDLDKDARRVEWASRRLAICNLDWDSLSSEDLFLLVSSFKPLGGDVESLAIYLSDMGKDKLEKEEREGPQLIVDENGRGREGSEESGEEEDEGELDEEVLKHNNKKREAIRKYLLERLKYFYAVVICDSSQTASAIYENCDGFEYEDSGLRLDLRFIPDDMTFDESRLKERVTADDVDSSKYKPKEVSNMAVATTKVKLTWEGKDVNRTRKMKGAFDEDADLDAVSKDLIAPSSGEEESDDETFGKAKQGTTKKLSNKDRLTLLLGGRDGDDDDVEVEWEKEEEDEEEKEKKSEKKREKKKKQSAWEQYLEKRKSKRKEKKTAVKEERRKAKEERDEEREKGEEKKRGAKKDLKTRKEETAEVAVDSRFNALFTDSAFSIDAASNLSKNKEMIAKQNAARRKRKADVEISPASTEADGGQKALINKLKNKSAKWSSA